MQRRVPDLLPPLASGAGCLLLTGCNWSQSVLAPRGSHAEAIDGILRVLFIGGALIFSLVAVLLATAILLRPSLRAWMASNNFIIGFGIVFPVITLMALLTFSSVVSRTMNGISDPKIRIEVIGEQFWWRVNYLDGQGNPALATANEIRIPVNTPVEFILKTQDVIHSFWVPSLAGKLDMIPGRTNRYTFAATSPGVYRGQCAEYCGGQHALMAFYVVAVPQAEYESWFAEQVGNAAEPTTPLLRQGRDLFLAAGCGSCHTIRGTPANGTFGPDLTRVGSRLSIAAGTYPVNVGTLAGWTSSAPHLKPGNLMPSFGNLGGEQLRAIAAYMESLK